MYQNPIPPTGDYSPLIKISFVAIKFCFLLLAGFVIAIVLAGCFQSIHLVNILLQVVGVIAVPLLAVTSGLLGMAAIVESIKN